MRHLARLGLLLTLLLVSACNLFSSTPEPVGPDTGSQPDMAVEPCDRPAAEICAELGSDCGTTDVSSICEGEVECGECVQGGTCISNQCLCVPESLPELCDRVGIECGVSSAQDNCGIMRTDVDCGACAGDGTYCDANICVCTPEADEDFCTRLVKSCGSVSAQDNCGVDRTVECGTCTDPATCGGGGTPNVCACSTQTDVDFCAANAATCGAVTALDACDQMRTVDCGSCAAPETCGGGGVDNTCGCTLETDAQFCGRLGAVCADASAMDNCGNMRTANCGSCPGGETCAGNQCVCVPESDTAFCSRLNADCAALTAPDNCGVSRSVSSCGMCSMGQTCTANQCDCMAESDSAFCSRIGAECGATSGTDNCAMARSVSNCGTCTGTGESCMTNQCVCTPESDTAFCARSGVECDPAGGSDNCGQARNVVECGPCGAGEACQAGQCVSQASCGDSNCDFGEVKSCVADCATRPIQVAAGGTHTCALLGNGNVLCWGQNNRGQFGTGDTISSPMPVATLFAGVSSISAGGRFTLVRRPADILAAGLNFRGQLGDGTTTDRSTPAPVSGLTTATRVVAGISEHGCALRGDGTVACWGRNFRGQLGDGTTTDSLVPKTLPSITGATAIAVGAEHSCAVVAGAVSCWGRGGSGQLGDGLGANSSAPVNVSGVSGASSLGAGNGHSCAMTTNGAVYCWGEGAFGQIGDGVSTARLTAALVPGLTAKQLSVGGDFACAIRTDDTVACWGSNAVGQLGDATLVDRPSPVTVSGLTNVHQISAGEFHVCAVLLDGTTRCWGEAINGQLGEGSTTPQSSPVQPTGL